MHRTLGQFTAYTIVGSSGTLVHYAVLTALVVGLQMNQVLASTFGAMLGAIFNYLINYRFTFKSSVPHRDALPRFMAVAALGLGVNAVVMQVGVSILKLHYLVAQVLATAVVLAAGYAANCFWTFRQTGTQLREQHPQAAHFRHRESPP
jgi:putative flippase GtrA